MTGPLPTNLRETGGDDFTDAGHEEHHDLVHTIINTFNAISGRWRNAPAAPTGVAAAGAAGKATVSFQAPDDGGSPILRYTVTERSVIEVSSAAQLTAALLVVNPGDTISLAPGVYSGHFVALSRPGTSTNPISLVGPVSAIIDGGSNASGYTLHIDRCDWWTVSGITVCNGKKVIMIDESEHVTLDGIEAYGSGDECVHFRNYSSYGTIKNSIIHDTGQVNGNYGEGAYFGTANSNWGEPTTSRTSGEPDTTDYCRVLNTIFYANAAECIDIKEGTIGGLVQGCTFSGAREQGLNGGDSWIDVKGNAWTIDGNVGTDCFADGHQVHNVYPGWGNDNVFTRNVCHVNQTGYAINVQEGITGTYVYDDNTHSGAGSGLTNVTVTARSSQTAPGTPTTVSGVDGHGKATVTFTPPNVTGGSPVTYTVSEAPA